MSIRTITSLTVAVLLVSSVGRLAAAQDTVEVRGALPACKKAEEAKTNVSSKIVDVTDDGVFVEVTIESRVQQGVPFLGHAHSLPEPLAEVANSQARLEQSVESAVGAQIAP